MKKILVLGLILMLFSCTNSQYSVGGNETGTITNFNIVVVDGCEYIQSKNGYGAILSHKGDCNNKIHQPIVVHDTIYCVNIDGVLFYKKLDKLAKIK